MRNIRTLSTFFLSGLSTAFKPWRRPGDLVLGKIQRRFSRNVERVENLVQLYQDLGGEGRGRRPLHSTDMLRAATVLLHSSLEDFLRSMAKWQWSPTDPDVLANIPLITGTTSYRRSTKFSLPDLIEHRNKKVGTILNQSLESYLDQSSYNNIVQICELLESFGINPDNVNERFSDLGDLMERRHWIVHQADRNPKKGRGHHRYKSISPARVNIWIEAVREFVEGTVSALEYSSKES